MVTSSAPAFTVTDNLTVTNGNLILQADNADYNVNNIAVSYTDATHYGTLTHNVPWGSHAVVISGNLAVDGKWVPAVRSFVKMQAPSGSSIQTLRTGDNFTSSTLSGLILETPGGFSPGGTFTLSGTLRVNQEAYILSGLTTGSFHLNGYHAIFSGDFLWNQSGSVYIDAGDGGSSPVLDVIDHTEFDSPCYMSAGTFNNGAAGHSGSMTITGSLTCSNSPVINNSGDWTNNGTFAPGAGTVTFNGAVAQALNGTATSQRFNNVNIVKTAGTTLGVSDNTTILTVNDLTETSGNFTAPATLNINGNATLTAGTFTAGTNTNLKGNWTNNGGSFNHNGGTISMAGSVGQTIGGTTATTFNNLTIDNASGVSLNHANTLTTIVCGTLLINSNKKLIIDEGKRLTVSGMLTNTTPDGLVVEADGSLIAPAGSTAQATVKRNIIAAGGGAWNNSWHFLSTPVTSQEINSSGGFIDTGSGYDFSAWDEPYNIWVNFQNHTIIPTWENVNTDNYFKIGKGYRAAYEQTGIKTFSGTLNVGNIGPISNLNISSGINHSWHLIGNPYSSALIWFTGWTTDKIATVCEIWNGSLKDYSPVLSGGIIPALNGFMAEATYNGASLTIPSTAKIHAGASWYNNTSSENIIKVTVWAQDKQSGKESYIVLDPLSTINFDPDFDGHYIGGFGPKFYSLAGEDDLSVNTLPGLTGDVQIPFVFVKNDASNFSIELDTTNLIPNIVIYLKDKKTGTDTELTKNPVYNFTSADGDNDNRFLMRFQDATSITNLDTARDFTIYAENDVITVLQTRKLSGKITVTDMAGRTVAIASLMAGSPMRIDMCGHTGVFIVSILTSRGISNTKIILK
jgi:hypothetical protein